MFFSIHSSRQGPPAAQQATHCTILHTILVIILCSLGEGRKSFPGPSPYVILTHRCIGQGKAGTILRNRSQSHLISLSPSARAKAVFCILQVLPRMWFSSVTMTLHGSFCQMSSGQGLRCEVLFLLLPSYILTHKMHNSQGVNNLSLTKTVPRISHFPHGTAVVRGQMREACHHTRLTYHV